MDQSRLRSPVVWGAIVAQVVTILLLTGVIGESLGETVKAVVAALLEIGVLIGILNNPTDDAHF